MPMPCYMKLTGTAQGKIDGSCQIEGHENEILVQAVEHVMELPRNPQTGLPSGKRQHVGLRITKEVDQSSPKILHALCSGEQMSSVELSFMRVDQNGAEEAYYSVTLENAAVVRARTWVPNCLAPEFRQFGHMEEVEFTYEKITWRWIPTGVEAEDSWLVPHGQMRAS